MRCLLVSMPWAPLEYPSLALSTLAPLVRSHPLIELVDICYGNVQWMERVSLISDKQFTVEHYDEIVSGYFVATGEWVFSSSLYGLEDPRSTEFYQAAKRSGADLEAAEFMFTIAPDFIEDLADEVVESRADIIGFTSTFDQNMASLALAKAIKKRKPEILTIMGGANCDDTQGAALHRNFTFLDFVVRGEGEYAFPALLDAIQKDRVQGDEESSSFSEVNGLCWRSRGQESRENAYVARPVPAEAIPSADFDDYFRSIEASNIRGQVSPHLQIEGGRGCWWGEKHHCTFCGLNGSLMKFRAKPAERVHSELVSLVERHKVLDVVFADNIIDMSYLKDLMPDLADLDWDLKVFFEVKSNLVFKQLEALSRGGVAQLQPGIESLSSPVLSLMRKGVSAWQNVRMLRDCRTLSIYPGWNLLYGFPGETEEDYLGIISQMRNLWHLAAPEGCNRIVLTRFSPYFNDPGLGLRNTGPSKFLSTVYRLPREELESLVYVFDSEEAGIGGEVEERLQEQFSGWVDNHRGARLSAVPDGDGLLIVDERHSGPGRRHSFNHELSVAYRGLLKGRSASSLDTWLEHLGISRRLGAADLLEQWVDDGLVFQDGDRYVALATGLGY